MSVGLYILLVLTILVYLGIGQRVLDKMRLNDRMALIFIATMILTTIFISDIKITNRVSVNIGGAIIPLILCINLFLKAGTEKEKIRAFFASLFSGIAIYFAGRFLPEEPETMIFNMNFLYGFIGGTFAYILGRSRRSAFIAGIIGVIISDFIQLLSNIYTGNPAPIYFGGAGAFDTTVLAGLIAVILAEIFGEVREKIQGGTFKKDMYFENGEFKKILAGSNKKRKDDNEK